MSSRTVTIYLWPVICTCPVTSKILQCVWFLKFPDIYRQEMNLMNIFPVIKSENLSNQYFSFWLIFQNDVSEIEPLLPLKQSPWTNNLPHQRFKPTRGLLAAYVSSSRWLRSAILIYNSLYCQLSKLQL